MLDISENKCTGCKMCADICPKSAISFEEKQGFWYPVIDNEKCIKCGLCEKKCPALNDVVSDPIADPDIWAVWSKNEDTRITSTSGGAFWEFAKYIIDIGGVVAGCRYTEDHKSAEHMIAYDEDGLQQLKGSKYFQSDTAGIYKAVKKELDNKKIVLFCGTPCQNAALKNYLNREYDNLYYMDFICRSINSPLAFRKYIEELEREYGSEAEKVHLKNKDTGWRSLATKVYFKNGKTFHRDRKTDWWVNGFIHNDLYTRPSCYNCKYKVLPRVTADISIGDFWGIKDQSDENMFKGISVLLINTEKGRSLFEKVRDSFTVQKHELSEVLPGNPALIKNPVRTKKQDEFFSLIDNHEFSYAVKKCIEPDFKTKLKRSVKHRIRKLKKTIKLSKKISITKYIYYNYLCKNIIRSGNGKILPYKGAVLDLDKTAKIYINGGTLEIGYNMLKGSKAETHVRMDKNAVWNCRNGAMLFYNTVLEIKDKAVFDTGFFSANGGSVIIADKSITFGEDVMIGRNVIVYDSDFHQLKDKNGIPNNPPEPVVIEDHVWLTSNIVVLKGVRIGKGSLIAAYTVVNKDIPDHSVVAGKATGKPIADEVYWDRARCRK